MRVRLRVVRGRRFQLVVMVVTTVLAPTVRAQQVPTVSVQATVLLVNISVVRAILAVMPTKTISSSAFPLRVLLVVGRLLPVHIIVNVIVIPVLMVVSKAAVLV